MAATTAAGARRHGWRAGECAGSRGTPADFQACATQAQQQQPCSLFVSQCFGNVGGAPAAGAGGGFGANAFSFHGH
jgi:hypothetical protein